MSDLGVLTDAGPLGTFLGIALAIWYAAREYRKGRAEDVEGIQAKMGEERQQHAEAMARKQAEVDAARQSRTSEINGLKDDLRKLQREVEELRQENITALAAAHDRNESLLKAYFKARQALVILNYDTTDLDRQAEI